LQKEIDEYFQQIQLNVLYVDQNINLKNFDNPIERYLEDPINI
jgi:hypothetical protein